MSNIKFPDNTFQWLRAVMLAAGGNAGGPALAEELPELPEQVVTATRTERERLNSPHAISVLGAGRIEQSNQTTIPDLFRYVPSVYVQKSNLGGGSPFIRGLTGKQVLILVDGVRLNNSFFRAGPHQYLNTIDPNIVDRIEVVRGPTSVLYGSDALGGTINVITRKRQDFDVPQALSGLYAGQFQTATTGGSMRLQVEGNWGMLGVLAGGTGKIFGHLDGGADLGDQVPTGYEEASGDLKLNYKIDNHNEFIWAYQFDRQFDVPKTNEVVLGSKTKFNYEPQERRLGYVEYRATDVGVFDRARINLSYGVQREGERIIDRAEPRTETRELTDVETLGATIQLSSTIGADHTLTYGFDFYRDQFATKKQALDRPSGAAVDVSPGVPDGTFYQSLGWFLQDEVKFGSSLEAVGGVRYSRYDTEGTPATRELKFAADAVVGNVNLLYSLSNALRLVGGVAWGFRAPNVEDFFGRVDFFNEIPNTNLQAEESFNYEFGCKYAAGPVTLETLYFNSDFAGFIDRVEVGRQGNGDPVVQRRNVRSATIQGVESIFEVRVGDQWRLETSLVWTEGSDAQTLEPLRRIPPINGNVRLRYSHNRNFWTEAAVVWADSQTRLAKGDISDPRIGPDGTPGYVVLDLRAGYRLARQHELVIGLENIADKKYKSHGSGVFNAGINAALTYRWRF